MKPALLVIDIQKAWVDSDEELKKAVELRKGVINSAIQLFKEKGLPIVAVYHTDRDGPGEDSPDFQFIDSIEISMATEKVIKNYPDAFNKTKLETILKENDCDTVVLCGLSGLCCVLATYYGALNRDLHTYLLKDGVAAGGEEYIRIVEGICDTLSTQALCQILP